MNRLLVSNSAKYRLLRTIIQGIIGVIVSNIDVIVAHVEILPMWARPIVVTLVMAILSPVMKAMGTEEMPEKAELPYNYYENGEEEDDGESE